MPWFMEVEYKTNDGSIKKETYSSPHKGIVFRNYRKWERNPNKFISLKMFEQHVRKGVRIKPRLHSHTRGNVFDDDIPF